MEELVERLWACLSSNEDEAKTIIHRIIQHFQSGLSSEERDVALHMFFQADRGIQSFMSALPGTKFKKVAADIFCIFSFLLDMYSFSLENYVVIMKDICMSFIKRESSSSDEKDKALDVIIALIRCGSWSCDLDVPSIINQLRKMANHRVSKPTVLRKVYSLIGTLAEFLPHHVNAESKRLLNSLLTDLEYQISYSPKVEFLIIEGCFEGLYGFLYSFPLNESVESETCQRISGFIKKVLAVQDTKRKTAPRAALNTLARHGDQFQSSLISKYQEWHQLLRDWVSHGKEERAVAKQALLTFYRVLANHASTQSKKDVLLFFSNHFKSQFQKSEDIDIVVKGFGLFAGTMKLHTPDEIPITFNILAQRSQEESEYGNHKSADYLDSLSVLSAQLGVIHSLQLAILESLSVKLISQFALEEHPSWQTVMVNALVLTVVRLNRCSGLALDMYLNTVVHQGIIRTVSHPIVQDAEILNEAGLKKITTYEDYLPLWLRLISMSTNNKQTFLEGIPLDESRNISKKLTDKILQSILDIIDRLDLTLKDGFATENYLSNVEKCVEANNPEDYRILVNLIDFTVALLSGLPDQSHLLKWISPLLQHNIKLSAKHPLVSSFYKWLASTVLIAQKLNYFSEQIEEMEDVNWRPTVNLLSGFLYDVISRQAQYQGELQVACLRLMLATPSCIATPLLRVCETAFQSVFRIGCSMLTLAQEGLQTLTRWNQDIPQEKMEHLLKSVLPSFDSLLQTRDTVPDGEDDIDLDGMAMVKKVLLDQKKKRLYKRNINTHSDTELVKLQKEVVLFLGTLNTSTCLSLLDGSEDRVSITSWQKEKLLLFTLPFPDMKVKISLDDMLPRLTDLAANCGDRQTRSSACEFLHSVIMFMLGTEKQLGTTHQGQMAPLWKHLFPQILSLACDMDLMISQLFKPLGEELARWYSSKWQENSVQSAVFLEALLNGITHQTDAAIRDHSANCLHEYVMWSWKQGRMLTKVKPVIKFVTSLCHHPCPQKRMGAALAFNSMYTVLREDQTIVDEFWLELLHGLVTALSLCSVTGDDSQTEVQIEKSLRNVLRVLMQCANQFNRENGDRRIPKEFGGRTLGYIVRWLLKYCTALNSKCRHICMEMVDYLAKKVPDCCSTKDFILKVIADEGSDAVVKIAEGDDGLKSFVQEWNQALEWVNSLLASMESYIWLIQINTPPETLFTSRHSKLMPAVLHLLDGIVHSPADKLSVWRPKAIEHFNLVKCSAIVRMIELFTIVLDFGQVAVMESLWSSQFMLTVVYCCVCPSYLGFDSSRSVDENLPDILEKFLKAFVLHAPKYAVDNLKDLLKSHVSSSAPALLIGFSEAVTVDRVVSKDRELLRGLKILQNVFEETLTWTGFAETTALDTVFQSIVKPVLNSDIKAPVTLGPLARLHAVSMLELYFVTSSELKPLFILMLDATKLSRPGLQADLTHGEHFVACFKETLVARVLKEPRRSILILEEIVTPDVSPRQLTILSSLFSSQLPLKSSKGSHLKEFIVCFFSKWSKFAIWAEKNDSREMWLISLLCQIVKRDTNFDYVIDCANLFSWIIKLLIDSTKTLPLKTDLIRCLPILCSKTNACNNSMKMVLQELKDQHFPLQSSEFKTGSEQYISFVRAFEALLQSLVMTGNCIVLQSVVKIMAIDPNHACRHLLPSTLENFMKRLQDCPEEQKEALLLVFKMFDDETLSVEVRVHILNYFLLKLMQCASLNGQLLFAVEVIKRLVTAISDRTIVKNEDDGRGRQKLVTQIGSWSLLQQIYTLPVQSYLEAKGSEIVIAAFSGTDTVINDGKELTRKLSARALDVFKCIPSKEKWADDLKELFRVYLCTVYNMFATLVSNLKTLPTDAKFYDKLLFDEKTRHIWRELVDNSRSYMLPYEQTEHMRNVQKVVSIRRKLNSETSSADNMNVSKTLHLLQSQSMSCAGSLEIDITRFDFTHSRVLSISGDKESDKEKSIVVLENDSLNNHECMATVCSVVRHLVDSGISPPPQEGVHPELPGWMESLRNSVTDSTCPRNSCIFILRLILNCEGYFSPYAIHWIQPLLDCTIKNCMDSGISYLLGDIIGLLATWCASNSSVRIERCKANKILEYLLKNCYSEKRPVFRYHLELIKSVLDVWKELIDPPHSLLQDMLKHRDKIVGINLTAIMLFYNLTPWTADSKELFLNVLMKNLQDNKKEVFKASSETLGLALKYLSQQDSDNRLSYEDESFLTQLCAYLKSVHSRARDCDRFLTLLHGIQENYPAIVDPFATTVLFYLNQTTDEKKAICLSLLVKRIHVVGDNPYRELKNCGLLNMLSDRNADVQMKSLQILTHLAPSLSEHDLYEVIHQVSTIHQYLKGEARHHVFEISLGAFDHYLLKQASNTLSDIERKILDESKALLLTGLVDPNVELQRKSFTQWTKEERLPSQASERLAAIFTLMYSPLTEEHFLSYSVPLLLEGTASTPDYRSKVFQHALETGRSEPFVPSTSYVVRNANPNAPMFAQSYSSQIISAGSLDSSLNESSFQLLATQNSLMFEPTVDSTDEIDSSRPQMRVASRVAKSSFLFSQDDGSYGSLRKSSSFKQGASFGAQRLRPLDLDQSREEFKTPAPSYRSNRFLGRDAATKVYSVANVRRAKRRDEMRKNSARKREGQVALYRKFKKGDFPFIELEVFDFVNPLKELAKRDTVIARIVMVNLFLGIKDIVMNTGLPCNFQEQAESLLNEVLTLSEKYEPSTIGACLEIAYHCRLNLNPYLISEASKNSALLALGVLLLESSARSSGPDENTWLYLAELYDGLGEREVAHATLMHNIPLGQISKAALEAHAEEQWVKAKRLYFEALSETKYDNFYESCFECMAVLSEWGQINKVIRAEVDGKLDNLWNISWYEKKLLPRLLHSEVLTIVHENRDQNQFMGVMNKWLSDETKGIILKERFCEILSVLCLVKKNFPQSRFFGSKTLSKFLVEWNELSPLFRKRREAALINTHNIADIMGFFCNGKELQTPDDCIAFLTKLEKVLPVSQDSLMHWETRISYRIACMNQMHLDVQSKVKEASLNMQLSLIEAALKQGNQDFAKKYIASTKSKVDSSGPIIKARWSLAQCWERHQWAEKEQNPVKRLDSLLQIWKKLDLVVASNELDKNPELSVTAHCAESNLSYSIRSLLYKEPHLLKTLECQSNPIFKWLHGKLQTKVSSSVEVISLLETIGLTSLLHSKNKMSRTTNQSHVEQTAEAYLQIALYCRRILESRQSAEDTFSKSLVKSTLSAMKRGSSRARQLFPILLQLPNLCSDHIEDFKKKSLAVPEWMFLGWIPQMLALLDTPAASVVGPLLLRIAEKYPNAISCPYSISKENFEKNSSNLFGQQFIQKLDTLLESSSLQIQLIKALACLTYPSIIIKDYVTKIETAYNANDWNDVERVCNAIFEDILDSKTTSLSHFQGNFFKSIKDQKIQLLFKDLQEAVNQRSQSVSEILERIKKAVQPIIELDSKRIQGFSKLKDFSPWLHDFSSSKLNENIEIPGQYTGDQKPAPERHVMISRFEENVQVMTSIRKPVKLTIIGSDAKSYNFLVKFGEDLRTDERIQQLLNLMNGIFYNNHQCRERQISIFTYKVVPLSSRLGIIEWVDDTSSLKELMLSSLSNEEAKRVSEIRAQHEEWLLKIYRTKNAKVLYGNAHKNIDRRTSITEFSKLLSMAKQDLLRRALMQWSSTAEAFYWLRHSFITSHSTLCISHWLLGVGDRHLSNCLVSQKNGKCIGIDFGHCFGSATQFLPVPELVPFRLTPHIVELLQPLGTKGTIEETMVIVLRALQADPEVLLATMQVFVQEPSLDWLLLSRKHFEGNEDNPTWLPALKIQQANRKLKGVNPIMIVKEDVESNCFDIPKADYCRTLLGDAKYNIRTQLPEENLTTRQQIECLIDLATDHNVLVKTYAGWEPWM